MNKAISFRDAFLYWLKLGFISFGVPTGQIAIDCTGGFAIWKLIT